MSILSRAALRELLEEQGGWCVSLFMPAHSVGREVQQDPIRLKNLLADAERRLVEAGVRMPGARSLLEPAQKLLPDSDFWRHQSSGLAVYLSPGLFRAYRLPLELSELVVVSDRFHVKPLLPLLSGDGQFYLLALSLSGVRLIQGARDSAREVDLEDVPSGLRYALRFDTPEEHLQFRAAPGGAGRGDRPALFHGQGAGEDDTKADILRYFHQVDRGAHELLAGEQAPLVLAGVDYLLPLYREANTYPYLVEEGVTGNPDDLRVEQLHARGWEIVAPRFQEAQEEAAGRYGLSLAAGQALGNLDEIVPAACNGRVGTLFVALDRHQWGSYDPGLGVAKLHSELEPLDWDLLDYAAAQTLLNSGTVYAVAPGRVPSDGLAAALLRY